MSRPSLSSATFAGIGAEARRAGDMNIHAYVRNDPINLTDPLGLDPPEQEVFVTARYRPQNAPARNFPNFGPIPSGSLRYQEPDFLSRRDRERPAEPPCDPDADPNCAVVDGERPDYGDLFACGGFTFLVAGGLCYDFQTGDVWMYFGVGTPRGPSGTVGWAPDASQALGGFSISGNGTPGGTISITPNGPQVTAFQTGTPGVQATYGVNVSQLYRNLRQTFVGGMSNYIYRDVNYRLNDPNGGRY